MGLIFIRQGLGQTQGLLVKLQLASQWNFLFFPLPSMMQPHMVGRHYYTDTYVLCGKFFFFFLKAIWFNVIFILRSQGQSATGTDAFSRLRYSPDMSPARRQTLSIFEGYSAFIQFKCCAGTSGSCEASDAVLVVRSWKMSCFNLTFYLNRPGSHYFWTSIGSARSINTKYPKYIWLVLVSMLYCHHVRVATHDTYFTEEVKENTGSRVAKNYEDKLLETVAECNNFTAIDSFRFSFSVSSVQTTGYHQSYSAKFPLTWKNKQTFFAFCSWY